MAAVIIAARDTAETVEEAAAATATTTTTAGGVNEKDTVPEAAGAGPDISGTGPVMDAAMAAGVMVGEAGVVEVSRVAAEAEAAGEEDAEEVTGTPPHVRHLTNLTEC